MVARWSDRLIRWRQACDAWHLEAQPEEVEATRRISALTHHFFLTIHSSDKPWFVVC
jgi:hypothetical protein